MIAAEDFGMVYVPYYMFFTSSPLTMVLLIAKFLFQNYEKDLVKIAKFKN